MRRNLIFLFLFLTACAAPQIAAPLATATVQSGQSIQQAVNAASAGETIIVPVGNYPESVRVSKNNLTIRCAVSMQCTAQRFDLWASGITLDGFVISGGKTWGVDVRYNNNTVRNVEIHGILYDFGLPRGQGDANGIEMFGTGHTFENIYIHDIDQYRRATDAGYPEPHQDCFQTWKSSAHATIGGPASNITIKNVICDMPQAGNTSISKALQSSGGSHDWTVRNLVTTSPMMCLFYDEAYNIDIAYSTFIGEGIEKPQGCKFLKLTSAPAPHDNKVTYSIFQNINDIEAFYTYVTGNNNCFWQVANHSPDPGDIFANPLLLPDWSIPANSPCSGKGASLSLGGTTPVPATSTPTRTPVIRIPTFTPSKTATPTRTPSAIPTVCQTMESTDFWAQVCTK